MGKSCAFFGHRDFLYGTYEKQVREIVVSLIEKEQVTQFYAGGRGAFDWFCAKIVADIKKEYSQILLTQVLSYIPEKKTNLAINRRISTIPYIYWKSKFRRSLRFRKRIKF